MFFADSRRAYFSEIERFLDTGRTVFLGNPHWSEAQRHEALAAETRFMARSRDATAERGRIFIATGGSGGKIRFSAHTAGTLAASARGLIRALGLSEKNPLNSFACLPPWHISGLMPLVRARVSGGKILIAEDGSFREDAPDAAFPRFRKCASEFWMNSLVPTQLRRILASPRATDWARGFDFILLGGAGVPADLIAAAHTAGLKFGIGYGMTETASLVALWRDGDAPAVAGTPLPHAKISISETDSRIAISADSLGETLADDGSLRPNPGGIFLTADEGKFDADGRLIVLGRADRYINSGGEKVDPAIVEAALISAGAEPALVVGEPDEQWGERVVAIVVSGKEEWELRENISRALPAWMRPKRFIRVPALPLDEKGKLSRAQLADFFRGNAKRTENGEF